MLLHNDGCLNIQIVSCDEIINSISSIITDELKFNWWKIKIVEITEGWAIKNERAWVAVTDVEILA